MRVLILCVSAAAIGFAAGYLVVSAQKRPVPGAQREAIRTDRRPDENQPASPNLLKRSNSALQKATRETASAGQILEKLKGIRIPAGEKRHASLRQIIHQLENLSELGPAALPEIREFLGKFEDVDYSVEA